jgi:glycosyltransferase involved in cell wall biosynthesis
MSSGNIHIVTISKNDEIGLSKTIQSLQRQDYEDWDCVIVLSGNADSALTYASELCSSDPRFTLLLQANRGIYEAMNLGLKNVESEFVWFMNGGDVFAAQDVVSYALKICRQTGVQILTGGYQYFKGSKLVKYERRGRWLTPKSFSLNIRSGCHQAMMVRIGDFPGQDFNLNFRLAADFDLILRLMKTGKALRVRKILAEIDPYGESAVKIEDVISEKQAIRKLHFQGNKMHLLLGDLMGSTILLKRKCMRILLQND